MPSKIASPKMRLLKNYQRRQEYNQNDRLVLRQVKAHFLFFMVACMCLQETSYY